MTSRNGAGCKGFSGRESPLHRGATLRRSMMSLRGEAVVLIGFMGSGKSSVGRHLAKRCGLPRYDTDEIVSARAGLPITEIFAQRGEDAFRVLESEALAQIPVEAAIVVTGGGIVLRTENVRRLHQIGLVVHLTADEATLFERVSRRATRPLLETENPRSTLSELLRVRDPLYRAAADFTVDTSRLRHEEVAEAILTKLESLRQTAPADSHE